MVDVLCRSRRKRPKMGVQPGAQFRQEVDPFGVSGPFAPAALQGSALCCCLTDSHHELYPLGTPSCYLGRLIREVVQPHRGLSPLLALQAATDLIDEPMRAGGRELGHSAPSLFARCIRSYLCCTGGRFGKRHLGYSVPKAQHSQEEGKPGGEVSPCLRSDNVQNGQQGSEHACNHCQAAQEPQPPPHCFTPAPSGAAATATIQPFPCSTGNALPAASPREAVSGSASRYS